MGQERLGLGHRIQAGERMRIIIDIEDEYDAPKLLRSVSDQIQRDLESIRKHYTQASNFDDGLWIEIERKNQTMKVKSTKGEEK